MEHKNLGIEILKSYAQGLDVSETQLATCVNTVANEYNTSQDDVCNIVSEEIHSIIDKVLDKTSKAHLDLKEYQRKALEYMFHNRGLVIAFDVGAGKTLTAASISYALIKQAAFFNEKVNVYIITPTSLQDNFKKEMKAAGFPITSSYHFYTIASFANAHKRGEINCKGSVVIVDEAHNLRKDYRGEWSLIKAKGDDEDKTRISKFLKCTSTAWKVILLTATPVFNQTYDVLNLAAMVLRQNTPPSAEEFDKLLKNPVQFKKYFGCMFAFFKPPRDEFPSRRDIYQYIPMNSEYLKKYLEIEQSAKQPKSKSGNQEKKKSAFMLGVRTASNNLTPCLKCDVIMNIVSQGKKTIIYSFFKGSGVDLIMNLLKNKHIPFRSITGTTKKADRQKIVNEINNDQIKILFITKAGGEGLDLKGIRNVILMEKGWNVATEEQVIGRAIRYRSHTNLPKNERNVTVYHLILIKPQDMEYTELAPADAYKKMINTKNYTSADLYLHLSGFEKQRKIDIFTDKLKNIDILSGTDCFP